VIQTERAAINHRYYQGIKTGKDKERRFPFFSKSAKTDAARGREPAPGMEILSQVAFPFGE
jgi:hypothetical protein